VIRNQRTRRDSDSVNLGSNPSPPATVDEVGTVPPTSGHIPANTKVVTLDWRTYAYRRGVSTGETRAKQLALKRASNPAPPRARVANTANSPRGLCSPCSPNTPNNVRCSLAMFAWKNEAQP
jgi:hypothetical protein